MSKTQFKLEVEKPAISVTNGLSYNGLFYIQLTGANKSAIDCFKRKIYTDNFAVCDVNEGNILTKYKQSADGKHLFWVFKYQAQFERGVDNCIKLIKQLDETNKQSYQF